VEQAVKEHCRGCDEESERLVAVEAGLLVIATGVALLANGKAFDLVVHMSAAAPVGALAEV